MASNSITSVELNYIIFRYLQESGFTHTAFTFGFEAGVDKSPIDGDSVPPAALVKLMQKGLEYTEMQANLSNDKNDEDEDFCLLQPMDLITKDIDELQKIVKEKKKNRHLAVGKELEKESEGASCHVKDKTRRDREKQDIQRESKNRVEKGSKRIRKKQRGSEQPRYQ